MKIRKAAALAFVASAVVGTFSLPANASAQANPIASCRAELDRVHALEGVCFWPEQGFGGPIDVHPNPKPTNVCGNNIEAGSMVNLTRETRYLYAFKGCQEGNLLSLVPPGQAFWELEHPAGSWR